MLTPKFANTVAWHQAEMLMQPIFIRVIDNLRKALDESSWRGRYQEIPLWPEGVSEATKTQVMELQQCLQAAPPDIAVELQKRLAQLPQPQPGYLLQLEKAGQQVTIDLWQLCYQICFRNYSPIVNVSGDILVDIDTSLIDETGEVDWQNLDNKTKNLVQQIFSSLPDV